MPAALIVGALDLEAGSFAAAAVTMAVRLATAYALAQLLTPKPPASSGNPGGEIQLAPYTDNKLPVVYGNTYVKPIIVDAIISIDQQHMWYVLAFCETNSTSNIHFDEVWYNNKLLLFNSSSQDGAEINGVWTKPKKASRIGGVVEEGPGGHIAMWFFNNGSSSTGVQHQCYSIPSNNTETQTTATSTLTAFDILGPGGKYDSSIIGNAGIPTELLWDSSKKMTNCVFAILRLDYDANNGVTGIGECNAKILNLSTTSGLTDAMLSYTIQGSPDAGQVIYDYLTNTVYGCGVDPNNINTASLQQVSYLSTQTHAIVATDGTTQTFYLGVNGIIDTTQDCLTNLGSLTEAVDGWLQWDERDAQWGVVLNQSLLQKTGAATEAEATATMVVVTQSQILGGINLVPTDLKGSPNKVTVSFPNADIIGQTDYRYYWLPANLKSPNEPENGIDISYPMVNDPIQGTYLGYKKMWMGRQDLVINFTMDYSGIQINAGDIIAVQHEWYGWGAGNYNGIYMLGKPFMVTQIQEAKDDQGFLSVRITAQAYNDEIYQLSNPAYYVPDNFYPTPDIFGLLTATNYISKPNAPIVRTDLSNSSTGVLVIQGDIPQYGNVSAMEFWYSATTSTFSANNFVLYETQYYAADTNNSASLYPHFAGTSTTTLYYEQIQVNNFPTNTYWWVTRAEGPNSTSVFSDVSQPVSWTSSGTVILGSQTLDGSIAGSKVVPPASNNQSSPSFFSQLGPALAAGAGGLALYYGYTNGWFSKPTDTKIDTNNVTPPDGTAVATDNSVSQPTIVATTSDPTTGADTTSDPQPGDIQTIVADATPQPPPVDDPSVDNFDDYA